MKTKIILPVFAVIAVLAIAFSTSAFKDKESLKDKAKNDDTTAKTKYATYYFQYLGSDIESEYEDSTKWQTLPAGDPGDTGCPGNDIVCILRTTDLTNLSRTELVNFLQAQVSAQSYCNDGNRAIHLKTD